MRGPRVGEFAPLVDTFSDELEGTDAEGEKEDMGEHFGGTDWPGGAYSPGAPARPPQTTVIRVRGGHG